MCSKISCPLCCELSFSSADVLRIALLEVTTKPLQCPLCNAICYGLDKLTIHLFTHGLSGNRTEKLCKDLPEYTKNVLSISEPISTNVQTSMNNTQIPNLTICISQNNDSRNARNLQVQQIGQTTQNNCTIVNEQQLRLLEQQNFQQNDQQNAAQPGIVKAQILPLNVPIQVTISQNETNDIVNNQDIINNKNQMQQVSPKFQLRPSQLEPIVTRLTNGVPLPEKRIQDDEIVMDDESLENDSSDTNKAKTRCDLCGFHFDSEKLLAMHAFIAHDNNKSFTRMELHACGLCEKTFRMPATLHLHRSVMHDGLVENQLTNSVVDKQSPSPSSVPVSSPFAKGNEQKQWNCDICSKSFTTKYFLKKHKRLHTGETPYGCNKCNKTFTFQQSFHKHLLYHNDEKPHACSHCGRTFKELSTLQNHQRIHTGEKPFACETCGKAFRQRVSYIVHRRIHTGAMPYKCTACDKSFRYKVSQRTHKCPAQTADSIVRQRSELLQKLFIPEPNAQCKSKSLPKETNTVPQIESQPLVETIDTPEVANIDNIVAESYDSMLLQTDNVCPSYTVTFQDESPEPKNQNYEDVDVLTLYECPVSLETINEDALKKLLQDE